MKAKAFLTLAGGLAFAATTAHAGDYYPQHQQFVQSIQGVSDRGVAATPPAAAPSYVYAPTTYRPASTVSPAPATYRVAPLRYSAPAPRRGLFRRFRR